MIHKSTFIWVNRYLGFLALAAKPKVHLITPQRMPGRQEVLSTVVSDFFQRWGQSGQPPAITRIVEKVHQGRGTGSCFQLFSLRCHLIFFHEERLDSTTVFNLFSADGSPYMKQWNL